MVRELFEAGHGERAEAFLRKAESASDAETFRKVLSVATKLCAGKADTGAASTKATKTFHEVGEWWTSGDARRDFPRQVKPISDEHASGCAQRLERAVYPRLGKRPIAELTCTAPVPTRAASARTVFGGRW
jgi:hypothetical protein